MYFYIFKFDIFLTLKKKKKNAFQIWYLNNIIFKIINF